MLEVESATTAKVIEDPPFTPNAAVIVATAATVYADEETDVKKVQVYLLQH
jgi:hypothetical protein